MTITKQTFFLNCVLACFLFSSCGSSKIVKTSNKPDETVTVKPLLASHNRAAATFKNLQGKISVSIVTGESEMGYTLAMRMAKNEKIWLNATLNIVRAIVTTEGVQFYNKLDRSYFDGNFDILSRWIGLDLNFLQLQNLILGQAILDFPSKNLELTFTNSQYELKTKPGDNLDFRVRINSSHMLADQQYVAQFEGQRSVMVNYKSYQNIDGKLIPETIVITVTEGNELSQIELQLKSMRFEQALNFPFNIPSGYKRSAL